MQDTLDTQAHAVRQARDVMDELPVNDYVSWSFEALCEETCSDH